MFGIGPFNPPDSTVILTVTAAAFAFFNNLLVRQTVDLNAERRMKAEIAAYRKELAAARKAKDQKEIDRLMKKQTAINQLNLKISNARLKVSIYTIVPFFIIYYLMLNIVGGNPAAWSPIYVPYLMSTTISAAQQTSGAHLLTSGGAYVTAFGWYFLSSLWLQQIMTRLLKTAT